MDLRDRIALRNTISDLVAGIGSDYGYSVNSSGIDALVAPGLDGTYDDQLENVDLSLLRGALAAIISAIPQTEPPSAAGGGMIGFAMSRSRCHYLWFC